jgi:peptide/nickel transport system substrate-binding protein
MQSGNAAPKGQLLTFLNANSIKVVDPLTIQFTLLKPWTGFPYLFTGVAGMIYSPTAFQKAGSPQAFAANPVGAGAGPFMLKTYRAGEVIEVERNPNYWGGDVNLDGIRFVLLSGPAANFEALKADQLQATFVRDPVVVRDAKEEGFGALDMPAIGGNLLILNSGVVITCTGGRPEPTCTGKPDGEKVPSKSATANLKVRQAISHAVDPEVINDRVYDGAAQPNSAPFANSPWDPGIEGPQFDLELAKKLVAEAKSEGWDGKIRVAAGNDPVATSWAQAVATMLRAANMEVAVDTSTDTQGVVAKVLVQRDWDIATWALGWLDEHDVNYLQLIGSFNTQNPRYGVTSPALEAAIDKLRTAETQEDRVEAYGEVTEAWFDVMPAHVISVIPQAMLYTPEVHGLLRSGASITLFHEAWYEQ